MRVEDTSTKKNSMVRKSLVTETRINIRFSDVDSMGIVWHGNYIRYFEDGREDFGKKYGLTYLDFYHKGIFIPLVKVACDYKKPLLYGDTARILTKFINCESAKIQYEYIIYNDITNEVAATGSSVQVFLDMNRGLLLSVPSFFLDWKKRNGLF